MQKQYFARIFLPDHFSDNSFDSSVLKRNRFSPGSSSLPLSLLDGEKSLIVPMFEFLWCRLLYRDLHFFPMPVALAPVNTIPREGLKSRRTSPEFFLVPPRLVFLPPVRRTTPEGRFLSVPMIHSSSPCLINLLHKSVLRDRLCQNVLEVAQQLSNNYQRLQESFQQHELPLTSERQLEEDIGIYPHSVYQYPREFFGTGSKRKNWRRMTKCSRM
ncbi:unnamed protein product [Larinioides sclopetarius]|uniref:Uncharacterized protein n=1 Tax=Larinioides sclopetarius TaxID=280406 RepID=A0AAV1YRW4_9ARAC